MSGTIPNATIHNIVHCRCELECGGYQLRKPSGRGKWKINGLRDARRINRSINVVRNSSRQIEEIANHKADITKANIGLNIKYFQRELIRLTPKLFMGKRMYVVFEGQLWSE